MKLNECDIHGHVFEREGICRVCGDERGETDRSEAALLAAGPQDNDGYEEPAKSFDFFEEHYAWCDHSGSSVTRVQTGFLNDGVRGATEKLCADCGEVIDAGREERRPCLAGTIGCSSKHLTPDSSCETY